jgi:isocitrate/isopropylmalate dehydrogenase
MANTFKNSITSSIGVTGVKVYEAPAGTAATIIGVNVANTATQNISVSVMLRDNGGNKCVYLVKNALIVQVVHIIWHRQSGAQPQY